MKTCGCDLNVLYVEVWENYLIISRCSRFNSIPENHFKIPFDEVPNDKIERYPTLKTWDILYYLRAEN